MRSKNWKLARACASPALMRLCLISMMTIDRPETAAEFFARRSKGRGGGVVRSKWRRCEPGWWAAVLRAVRTKNWKLAMWCASPAVSRLCLIAMMTIDRTETAAEFFARRSKGRAVGDLDRILDKVPDRPPEPGDELKAGRPIAYIAGNRRGCREIRARDLARHVGRNLGPGPLAGLGSATSRATVPAPGA